MILLDTHVVIWLMTSPERLSKAAAEAIAETSREGARPGVSSATIFELFYAKRRGRLEMHTSDAALLERLRAWYTFCPITETIALEAALLPEPFHGDPVDRLIAATARLDGRTLITADRKLLKFGACKALW